MNKIKYNKCFICLHRPVCSIFQLHFQTRLQSLSQRLKPRLILCVMIRMHIKLPTFLLPWLCLHIIMLRLGSPSMESQIFKWYCILVLNETLGFFFSWWQTNVFHLCTNGRVPIFKSLAYSTREDWLNWNVLDPEPLKQHIMWQGFSWHVDRVNLYFVH